MNGIVRSAFLAAGLATAAAATFTAAPAAAQGAYRTEERFIEMERLITQLTGQVERLQNQVQQLQQQMERQQADYDYRLRELEGRGGGARPPGGAAPRPPAGGAQVTPPAPGGLSPGQVTDTRPLGGAVIPPPGGQGLPPAPPAPPAAAAGSGSPEQTYNAALSAMGNSDYAGAERGFRDFLARFPRHALAGNAQYWLGETYYIRRDYAAASAAFANGYKNYRSSPKGPDNLLKLGMSLQATGKSEDACVVYGQFPQVYPNANDVLKRRVAAERQRSRCG